MDFIECIDVLVQKITSRMEDVPETGYVPGYIIRSGIDKEIDEYRTLLEEWNHWIYKYTEQLINETGILSLKVKYTPNVGYYIEIPISQKPKVPKHFLYITTLTHCARYTTQELKEFWNKILFAQEYLLEKENECILALYEELFWYYDTLKTISTKIAMIDFFCSLAWTALKYDYVRPTLHTGFDLSIVSWRHPILERVEDNFVANDLTLDKQAYIALITWPNMWGKSTYLKQNALIVLLAHMGSFVPAKKAYIPVTDKIFSRIGASDNLMQGASTFMVEMQEVSNILHNATKKSFIIIDEIGRGTSTYDGMSLAWAILKYCHTIIGAKVLFATHYHELVDESSQFPWVKNVCVAVAENEGEILFLRKIIPGSMKKSYGIEVARLAGIPKDVLDDAEEFLLRFEWMKYPQLRLFWKLYKEEIEESSLPKSVSLKLQEYERLKKWMQELNPDTMTPLEALETLYNVKYYEKTGNISVLFSKRM